jgi:hypothetical protein
MDKFFALMSLFRKGAEVANPEAWKAGQINANIIAGLILAISHLADTFGFGLNLTTDQSVAIGTGVLVLVNVVLTAVTSKRAGLPAKPEIVRPVDPPHDGG